MANLRQSIYGGMSEFLMRSEKQAQFTAAAAVGATAFGAYGVAKGAVSDNTTMFGGGVGGATFGAAVGAGLAYAASGAHGKGMRNVLRNLNNKFSGADLAAEDMSRRTREIGMSPKDWESAMRSQKTYQFGDMNYNTEDLLHSVKKNRGFQNVSMTGKKEWEAWFDGGAK
jgi:hypothetical protein